MNKQQMEQIIYEEFVNNIYENAKFDLSEEKSRMIEEFMNQIFNENTAKALGAKRVNPEDVDIVGDKSSKPNLSDQDKLQIAAAAIAKEKGEDPNLGASAKTGPGSGSKPDLTPQEPISQDPDFKNPPEKSFLDMTPEEKAEFQKQIKAQQAAELEKASRSGWGEGDKDPEASAGAAKNAEAKKDAEETTEKVVYVIQQAAPQSYFKRHGIVGGILKKGFEVLFGTGIWDDPADATYLLRGIYQNPYDAPKIMVQTLQQYREQLAGLPPATQKVVSQVVDAAKEEDAKMEADPEKEEADATEDERQGPPPLPGSDDPTDVTDDAVPVDDEEEAKIQVPKDDIDLGGLTRNKNAFDKWNAMNLHDAPPGKTRIQLAQQLLAPTLLKYAVDSKKINEDFLNEITQFIPGTQDYKLRKAKKKADKDKAEQDRIDFEDREREKKKLDNLKTQLLGTDELYNTVSSANLASIKSDGLFGSIFNLLIRKNKAWQIAFLNRGPEVFARAMAGFTDSENDKLIPFFPSNSREVLKNYIQREKEALDPKRKKSPAADKKPEGTPLIPRSKGKEEPTAAVAEGMQAFMEKQMKSRKLTTPKTGEALLKWVLTTLAAQMKTDPDEIQNKKDPKRRGKASTRRRDRGPAATPQSPGTMKMGEVKKIKKSSLTQENITKAVTKWHANKGIVLQEGKAKKIAESILKVIK